MLHVVPILCLIFFIWFIEMQLKKEMHKISEEFKELKEKISNNKENIQENRSLINKNRSDINKLGNGEHLQ